jgi:hypothetical protein
MKIKVSNATNIQLDWMVAKADQPVYSDKALIRALTAGTDGIGNEWEAFSPTTNWAQGGPIIEREFIDLAYQFAFWRAWSATEDPRATSVSGPTPLIAAMRCYVTSKLGEEVEVPDDLT